MGILTSAYRVTPDLLQQFLADGDNMDIIFYPDKKSPETMGLPAGWQPPKCRFDKQWDDMICAVKGAGFRQTAVLLETVHPIDYKYADFYIRYWTPETALKLADCMAETSAAEIERICLEKGDVRDYDGYIFGTDSRYPLDYVLDSYDRFAVFVRQAVEQGDRIMAVSA